MLKIFKFNFKFEINFEEVKIYKNIVLENSYPYLLTYLPTLTSFLLRQTNT